MFDIIRVIGGKKSPREVWKRLCQQYPEVVTKCDNLRFPGSGQRLTPVTKDKQATDYILGLLPGAAGRTYREEAAKLYVLYLEADTRLAESVVRRSNDLKGVRKVAEVSAARTKQLEEYHGLMGALKQNAGLELLSPALPNSTAGRQSSVT